MSGSTKHECRNWEGGRAIPFLGIFVSNSRYCLGSTLQMPLCRTDTEFDLGIMYYDFHIDIQKEIARQYEIRLHFRLCLMEYKPCCPCKGLAPYSTRFYCTYIYCIYRLYSVECIMRRQKGSVLFYIVYVVSCKIQYL
jgi:hypothetical protein